MLAKDQNHEISCVEICFIFLANIDNLSTRECSKSQFSLIFVGFNSVLWTTNIKLQEGHPTCWFSWFSGVQFLLVFPTNFNDFGVHSTLSPNLKMSQIGTRCSGTNKCSQRYEIDYFCQVFFSAIQPTEIPPEIPFELSPEIHPGIPFEISWTASRN